MLPRHLRRYCGLLVSREQCRESLCGVPVPQHTNNDVTFYCLCLCLCRRATSHNSYKHRRRPNARLQTKRQRIQEADAEAGPSADVDALAAKVEPCHALSPACSAQHALPGAWSLTSKAAPCLCTVCFWVRSSVQSVSQRLLCRHSTGARLARAAEPRDAAPPGPPAALPGGGAGGGSDQARAGEYGNVSFDVACVQLCPGKASSWARGGVRRRAGI